MSNNFGRVSINIDEIIDLLNDRKANYKNNNDEEKNTKRIKKDSILFPPIKIKNSMNLENCEPKKLENFFNNKNNKSRNEIKEMSFISKLEIKNLKKLIVKL